MFIPRSLIFVVSFSEIVSPSITFVTLAAIRFGVGSVRL